MNYRGMKIVVLGLGKSGIAVSKFLADKGAFITAIDRNKEIVLPNGFENERIKLVLGENTSKYFANADLVVVSPGVPPSYEGLQDVIKNGNFTTELEIARNEIKKPVIAVTGTNGKTTTVNLLRHLIDFSGKKACLAGNVGYTLIGQIEEANKSDYVILEVSSFQLFYSKKFESDVVVWINLTPDHLDWHSNLQEYIDSKKKLVDGIKNGGCFIYNHDDEVVKNIAKNSKVKILPFSVTKQNLEEGGFISNNSFNFKIGNDCTNISTDKINLYGIHNKENVLASILTCLTIGIGAEPLERGLREFKGLPHRIEFVRERLGVKYFDDSKGTNVGATVAALRGFDGNVILIAGGQEKNTDWDDLVNISREKVKHAILIGQATESLKKVLSGVVPFSLAKTMDEAVKIAESKSQKGDTVLLSPACASFDMFKNYAERGEIFKRAVEKL